MPRNLFGNILLHYHTLKYLQPVQVYGRILDQMPQFIQESKQHPPLQDFRPSVSFIPKNHTTLDLDSFSFLNEPHRLSVCGWDNPAISLLWRYNLHYFDFINQEGSGNAEEIEEQSAIIRQWIAENSFGKGTGWMPYPNSLRIVNWIKWHWRTGGLSERALVSLFDQVRLLADRPEYHVQGNHLFTNAKALCFASAFFKGPEAAEWYRLAAGIIEEEMDEQFLADGAQYELSPMYHCLAIEDLLDLCNIAPALPAAFPLARIRQKILKGLSWLADMHYPNGELAHFNDVANGIAPAVDAIFTYAVRLGLRYEAQHAGRFWLNPESGFFVLRDGPVHLIADLGRVGPDHLMAHAHADSLSFELAIAGRRLIVNSGTSLYGTSPERIRQRGTAAHSTLEIDGQDSSEVWMGFRVARRAYPTGLEISGDPNRGPVRVSCAHDGYTRLPGRPVHRRTWDYEENILRITDTISGHFRSAKARFHLHPDVEAVSEKGRLELWVDGTKFATVTAKAGSRLLDMELREGSWHSRFGESIPNKCLEIDQGRENNLETIFEMSCH